MRVQKLSWLVFVVVLMAACVAPSPAPVLTPAAVAAAESAITPAPLAPSPVAATQPPVPPADTTAPTTTLTADDSTVPWDGQTIVRAAADDPSGIATLTVLLGDQVLALAEEGELAFDLIPGAVEGVEPGGEVVLVARAVDAAGNEGRAILRLRFGPAPSPTPSAPTATPTRQPTSLPTDLPAAKSTATPTAQPTAPPVAPAKTSYRVTEITLATYPYAAYLRPASDPTVNGYPLSVLDRAAYEAANPQPAPKKYRLIVLENRYLRLGILPDLGGRIYECTFKPTGHNELYSNPVIKPTGWGPPSPPYPAGANWWLAAGGIEWGFPVEEHGYEWGTSWGFDHVTQANGGVMVTVFTRGGPQSPYAVVDVILPPDTAYFVIQPHIINPQGAPFRFKWWANAMLAPGAANTPGPELRFILPASEVTVHSTGDPSLPGAGQALPWPVVNGRDLSRLGNWAQWLGVFRRSAAAGGYAGVYDPAADEGMLRIYPTNVVRGVKLFAMGWSAPIGADNWTDDGSGYVELHGGLMPTFDDWFELAPGDDVTWSEIWYPAAGIGGVTWASDDGALALLPGEGLLKVGFFPTVAVRGRLTLALPGAAAVVRDVTLDPARPFVETIALPDVVPAQGEVAVTLLDAQGRMAFEWRGQAALR